MADIRTQPVESDLGSEELRKLRLSYNALLEGLGTFLDEVEAATAVADVATAATNFLALLEIDATNIPAIGGLPNIPERRSRPVTS